MEVVNCVGGTGASGSTGNTGSSGGCHVSYPIKQCLYETRAYALDLLDLGILGGVVLEWTPRKAHR